MAERTGFQLLKRRVKGALWQRIESPIMVGWPDLLAIKNGHHTWIEGKQLDFRARTNLWILPRHRLKATQRPTWRRIQDQGGVVYLMVRTRPSTAHLLTTTRIDDLMCGVTESYLKTWELDPNEAISYHQQIWLNAPADLIR